VPVIVGLLTMEICGIGRLVIGTGTGDEILHSL
jgi:hypothetical protein